MRSLCSWILCTSLLTSAPMMAQMSSDRSVVKEGMEGQNLEEYDSLLADETALIVERWEEQMDASVEEPELREWLVDLRGETMSTRSQYKKTERELHELEAQNLLLIQRQGELVGLIRDLVMEEEPDLLQDSLDDTVEAWEAEKKQESIRLYEYELSLIEQTLASKEVAIRTHMHLIDDLKDRLYELETEIEDLEMIHVPLDVLTTIDEE